MKSRFMGRVRLGSRLHRFGGVPVSASDVGDASRSPHAASPCGGGGVGGSVAAHVAQRLQVPTTSGGRRRRRSFLRRRSGIEEERRLLAMVISFHRRLGPRFAGRCAEKRVVRRAAIRPVKNGAVRRHPTPKAAANRRGRRRSADVERDHGCSYFSRQTARPDRPQEMAPGCHPRKGLT